MQSEIGPLTVVQFNSEKIIAQKIHNIIEIRGVFSTGAMGALEPAILKIRLLEPAIFGHFSNVGKNCWC